MTSFGPQLIGETEKTLNAILRTVLTEAGLTEPEWVTLRLAAQHDGHGSLAAAVTDRAHFGDTSALVAGLNERGLLDGDTLSPAGAESLAGLLARIDALTAPIWADLPSDDVRATERVLGSVIDRARAVLGLAF